MGVKPSEQEAAGLGGDVVAQQCWCPRTERPVQGSGDRCATRPAGGDGAQLQPE